MLRPSGVIAVSLRSGSTRCNVGTSAGRILAEDLEGLGSDPKSHQTVDLGERSIPR